MCIVHGGRPPQVKKEIKWVFAGVVDNPHENKFKLEEQGLARSLTAHFQRMVVHDGKRVSLDPSCSPNEMFLTREEMDNGIKAAIHNIYPSLIALGLQRVGLESERRGEVQAAVVRRCLKAA